MQRYNFFCISAKLFVPLSAEMKNNKLPAYFTDKHNAFLLVLITALFSELFFFIFEPFRSRELMPDDWQYLLWVTIMILIAMTIMTISRVILYFVTRKRDISIVTYSFWIFGEVAIISLIYTLFLMLVFHDNAIEYEWTFFPLLKDMILGTAVILLIPYFTLHLLFVYRNLAAQMQELSSESSTLGEDLDKYNFYDEKGELRLSIQPSLVYYLESADNYVQIHYLNGNKMDQTLIRNSLKNIEWRFRDKHLIRCHRSFIVNLKNVKLLRREENEVVLDFSDNRVPAIPVSKSYSAQVMKHFTQLT